MNVGTKDISEGKKAQYEKSLIFVCNNKITDENGRLDFIQTIKNLLDEDVTEVPSKSKLSILLRLITCYEEHYHDYLPIS